MIDHSSPLTIDDIEAMIDNKYCACCKCVFHGNKIKSLHIELGSIGEEQLILAVLCNRCKTIFEALMPFFDEELFLSIPEDNVVPIVEYYKHYFEDIGKSMEESMYITTHEGGDSKEEMLEDLNFFEEILKYERARLLSDGE